MNAEGWPTLDWPESDQEKWEYFTPPVKTSEALYSAVHEPRVSSLNWVPVQFFVPSKMTAQN